MAKNEKKTSNGSHKRLWIGSSIVLLILIATLMACVLYVNNYYEADRAAIAAFAPTQPIRQETLEDGSILFYPYEVKAGLVFYPGGRVEHAAYIPLMRALAAEGVLCVLVEMPCRLAALDANAADAYMEAHPEVKDWYVGGHSLGGAMAARFAKAHTEELTGLVLLGAYTTKDLSNTSLRVLSVYGSEDGVMNREKYEKNKENLPSGFTEVVIEGGCHAYFGAYGAQKGDGTPTITLEEQIAQTAAHVLDMMQKGGERV